MFGPKVVSMKIADLVKAGSRCDVRVKVVEVTMSAEVGRARACEALVADETGCVLLTTTSNLVTVKEREKKSSLLSFLL